MGGVVTLGVIAAFVIWFYIRRRRRTGAPGAADGPSETDALSATHDGTASTTDTALELLTRLASKSLEVMMESSDVGDDVETSPSFEDSG